MHILMFISSLYTCVFPWGEPGERMKIIVRVVLDYRALLALSNSARCFIFACFKALFDFSVSFPACSAVIILDDNY
jgi:hypothetical protein